MIFQRAPGACADASDRRLKRDIELVRTFPDGLRLYRFRYVTDHRPFMSVVAQELLEDAHIALAVLGSACGFLRLEYRRLGLRIADLEAMRQAGEDAIRAALTGQTYSTRIE